MLRWLILFIVILCTVGGVTLAAGEREAGVYVSTNLLHLAPIGIFPETSTAPALLGLGAYTRLPLGYYNLHLSPWAEFFPTSQEILLAGGFNLLWEYPSLEPTFSYLAFGFMITNIFPIPVTNFVLGFEGSNTNARCNFHVAARLFFIPGLMAGFSCSL